MMWRFDNLDWEKMAEVMEKGGCGAWGGGNLFSGLHLILGLVTWILVIILLVGLIRMVFKKGK